MPSMAPTRRARSADSCRTAASACITKILWISTAASASVRAWWLQGDRQSGIQVSGINNSDFLIPAFLIPRIGRKSVDLPVLLLAQSGHLLTEFPCPLLGVK